MARQQALVSGGGAKRVDGHLSRSGSFALERVGVLGRGRRALFDYVCDSVCVCMRERECVCVSCLCLCQCLCLLAHVFVCDFCG